jgi:hypothetical protein
MTISAGFQVGNVGALGAAEVVFSATGLGCAGHAMVVSSINHNPHALAENV